MTLGCLTCPSRLLVSTEDGFLETGLPAVVAGRVDLDRSDIETGLQQLHLGRQGRVC